MKVISWFGALILFVAVAAGTSSVLRLHSQGTPALAASRVAAPVASGSQVAIAQPNPTAAPKPAPKKAKPAPPRAAAPAPRPVVTTAIVIGSTQQVLINQDRARYGLRPLTWSSCLASVAYSNAVRMALAERMWHANGVYSDLACHLGNRTGENIGYWTGGITDSRLNTMFMNSPEHKANILGPYRYVATAWRVAANGTAYIAVEFS
ncbi:MAG TPA: CAP domain-containing protein [Candidatus Dormibacteraeota bacterium]|nr:CAP domain-containing protein [Candidatus Dormibacteraeota bacterium]